MTHFRSAATAATAAVAATAATAATAAAAAAAAAVGKKHRNSGKKQKHFYSPIGPI